MTNFSHMAMAGTIAANPKIEVKKRLFGLFNRVIYKPTRSSVVARRFEYSAEEGEQLKRLLDLQGEALEQRLKVQKQMHHVDLGSVELQTCYSLDHRFAALQLMNYRNLCYEPITAVRIFEGRDAELMIRLL